MNKFDRLSQEEKDLLLTDMYEALNDIAAWDDVQANQHLEATGSFGGFDEPGSVSIARAVLAKVQP